MKTCKHILQHSMQGLGKTHTSICGQPVYRDGFCHKHYTNFRRKKTPWGERKEYGPITIEEMRKGFHFKPRYTHIHRLLRLRANVIQEWKTSLGYWIDTDLEVNPEAYCKKKY